MRTLKPMRILLAMALTMSFVAPVYAQSASELNSRIKRVEKQLQAVQRKVFNGKVPADMVDANDQSEQNLLADMDARLLEIERQMRELTGRVEVAEHMARSLDEEFQRYKGDIELRLKDLASGGAVGATSPATGGASATITPASSSAAVASAPNIENAPNVTKLTEPETPQLPTGKPMEQYNYAYAFLNDGKYAEAQMAFSQFVKEHPKHQLSSNAQYWLGESYYARQMWPQALEAFFQGYQKYGDGPKGPDSLLKMALTLSSMGEKDEACVAFNELLDVYPNASTNIRKRLQTEKDRLKCP